MVTRPTSNTQSRAKRRIAKLKLEFRVTPQSHWLATEIASELYELRRYREAVRWNDRAHAIDPRCPLVLWNKAGAMYAIDQTADALRLWRRLYRTKFDPTNSCFESKTWYAALQADAAFRIGLHWHADERTRLAREWFSRFLKKRLDCPSRSGVWKPKDLPAEFRYLHSRL